MSIDVRCGDGIAEVVLNDPPLNILTRQLLTDLRTAMSELADDPTLRVLVLGAEGKHFSAGASVEEHMPGAVEQMIPEFMETIRTVRDFPLPVLCAVHGRCLGGALELAMGADIVLASEDAVFGVPEIGLGVIPPAACVQLPATAPRGVAAELVFTGAPIDANTAHTAGIVLRVVAHEALSDETIRLASMIARHSAAALRRAKETLLIGSEVEDAALTRATRIYLESLMATTDATEGLRSFIEKRKPHWTHS